jgi:16S rRNA (uracil1498-N3)-methyltransferase
MHLFFDKNIDEGLKTGSENKLPAEEAKHAIKVLRLRVGDEIYLTNGRGLKAKAVVAETNKKAVSYRILEMMHQDRRAFSLHMVVAPTKNIKRFEWFLEKATEVGIEEITPVFSFHSERREIKTARSEAVIAAAVKQSLKAWHPLLNQPLKFKDFIKKPVEGQKFIAHYTGPEQLKLSKAVEPGQKVTVLIGPEGDFSREEVEQSIEAGYIPVSLGDTRLRTETAALAAVFITNIVNEK